MMSSAIERKLFVMLHDNGAGRNAPVFSQGD